MALDKLERKLKFYKQEIVFENGDQIIRFIPFGFLKNIGTAFLGVFAILFAPLKLAGALSGILFLAGFSCVFFGIRSFLEVVRNKRRNLKISEKGFTIIDGATEQFYNFDEIDKIYSSRNTDPFQPKNNIFFKNGSNKIVLLSLFHKTGKYVNDGGAEIADLLNQLINERKK